jgi:hypothetical protein
LYINTDISDECAVYILRVEVITMRIEFHLVGGGVQLGPLGTAATDWPIVPAMGDYDDGEFGGMKIDR